eukprot:COSAG01_NODE_2306_length_7946_cov_4.903148_9_plen_32_part_00
MWGEEEEEEEDGGASSDRWVESDGPACRHPR